MVGNARERLLELLDLRGRDVGNRPRLPLGAAGHLVDRRREGARADVRAAELRPQDAARVTRPATRPPRQRAPAAQGCAANTTSPGSVRRRGSSGRQRRRGRCRRLHRSGSADRLGASPSGRGARAQSGSRSARASPASRPSTENRVSASHGLRARRHRRRCTSNPATCSRVTRSTPSAGRGAVPVPAACRSGAPSPDTTTVCGFVHTSLSAIHDRCRSGMPAPGSAGVHPRRRQRAQLGRSREPERSATTTPVAAVAPCSTQIPKALPVGLTPQTARELEGSAEGRGQRFCPGLPVSPFRAS